jgi:hypothetical protein
MCSTHVRTHIDHLRERPGIFAAAGEKHNISDQACTAACGKTFDILRYSTVIYRSLGSEQGTGNVHGTQISILHAARQIPWYRLSTTTVCKALCRPQSRVKCMFERRNANMITFVNLRRYPFRPRLSSTEVVVSQKHLSIIVLRHKVLCLLITPAADIFNYLGYVLNSFININVHSISQPYRML